MILSMTDVSSPLSSATRSRKAGSKAISPFIERAVIAATCALMPTFVGQLVDAFLVDHGGIHVGDQDLLAASVRLLHDDVDRLAEEQRCAERGLGFGRAGAGRQVEVAGDGIGQPDGFACADRLRGPMR